MKSQRPQHDPLKTSDEKLPPQLVRLSTCRESRPTVWQ